MMRRGPLTKREARAIARSVLDDTLSGVSTKARACVSKEIAKHCRKKRGRKTCRRADVRAQAVAIGYSICHRKGFRT